jgi:hypothetical protein
MQDVRDDRAELEALALEYLESAGELPHAHDLAQWMVERRAAEGEYSGRVDDGDAVREYEAGEYSVTAMEIDFTQFEAYAEEVLGR